MKQSSAPFSIYALIIALLVHIIVFLLLVLFNQLIPPPIVQPKPPKEKRFQLNLDQYKTSVYHSNKIIQQSEIPKLSPKKILSFLQPQKITIPTTIITSKNIPQISVPENKIPSNDTKYIPPIPITEPTPTIKQKKQTGLYDLLSKSDGSASQPIETNAQRKLKKIYGAQYDSLSNQEIEYLIDNFDEVHSILQSTFSRLFDTKIPDNIRITDFNIIEFYFYPDGHVSGLHVIQRSSVALYDDITVQTVETSFAKFPRPNQKTRIRVSAYFLR